ncbi:MAG: aspartate 1-decarboxylase [Planctomyces sp.]|nr:aspartate 1-decarboxylase [Planctomyces sp.]
MLLRVLKAKLHLATVTRTELNYHGSITIAEDLMEAVGFLPFEQVLIGNCANGARGETYVIRGPRGSGAIELNGAMAHLASPGHRIIVMSFAFAKPRRAARVQPKIAILDESNHIIEQWAGEPADAPGA